MVDNLLMWQNDVQIQFLVNGQRFRGAFINVDLKFLLPLRIKRSDLIESGMKCTCC